MFVRFFQAQATWYPLSIPFATGFVPSRSQPCYCSTYSYSTLSPTIVSPRSLSLDYTAASVTRLSRLSLIFLFSLPPPHSLAHISHLLSYFILLPLLHISAPSHVSISPLSHFLLLCPSFPFARSHISSSLLFYSSHTSFPFLLHHTSQSPPSLSFSSSSSLSLIGTVATKVNTSLFPHTPILSLSPWHDMHASSLSPWHDMHARHAISHKLLSSRFLSFKCSLTLTCMHKLSHLSLCWHACRIGQPMHCAFSVNHKRQVLVHSQVVMWCTDPNASGRPR